jgi:hypothetical protein
VALAGAIRRALEPELGARLGASGRARALGQFTVEAMVSAYERLYAQLARRRR